MIRRSHHPPKKNYKKLYDANQLDEGDEVEAKDCIECNKPMNWRLGDPICLRKKGYQYRERHYGECIKVGQNDDLNAKVSIYSTILFALAMKGGEFLLSFNALFIEYLLMICRHKLTNVGRKRKLSKLTKGLLY